MEYTGMKLSRVRDHVWVIFAVVMFLSGCATSTETTYPAQQPVTQTQTIQTQAAAYDANRQINNIQTVDSPAATTVVINSDRKLTYTSVKQSFPLGVVLYFPQTQIINSDIGQLPVDTVISAIDPSEDAQSGACKVAILMKNDTPYEVTQNDGQLKVLFKKTSMAVQQSPSIAQTASQPAYQANTMVVETPTVSPATASPPIPVASSKTVVNRIDFSSEGSGKSTITIGTTHPARYDIRKISDTILVVDLFNTDIPDYHQRQLITTRFESAVDRIIPAQTPSMKNNASISIELREAVPYFVEQKNNLILVHFEGSSVPPRPMESANLPSWKKILDQSITELEKMESLQAEEAASPEVTVRTTDQYFEEKVYTGEKIALDFYETDIKNVFRILREISGKNFIIDDDVKGKVTMTLDKPVPWDQILDLVLKMNQLGLVYEGDIIRIATLATIKRESNAILDSITAEREAKEKIKDMAPVMTEYIAISYSNAKDEILPHLEGILTADRGSISVDERNNQIIITDTSEKIEQAKRIVKNIDKVTPQVIIEAKVVEVSKNFSRDVGVNWAMSSGIQNDDANSGVGPQRGMDILGGTWGWDTAMNFPVADGGTIGINFNRIAGTPFALNAKLSALEVSGDVKIISSPKIVTLDNKKASIRQGLEVGYYDTDKDNTTGRTVSFKKVDLLLEVTPHVTPDARVSMSIFITKNDVDQYIDNIPSIATNEAQTELLVNDGDTIVIGGIMKNTQADAESGFPVLSKIPGLGRLFKLTTDSDRNNELLIFITPRIVQLEQKVM